MTGQDYINASLTIRGLDSELARLRASHDLLLAAAKALAAKLGNPTLTEMTAEFTALENAIAAAEEQAP